MQLNINQYKALTELWVMANTHKKDFTESELTILNKADDVLTKVFTRHQETNKRTAEYIAKKRVLDKNYARSK